MDLSALLHYQLLGIPALAYYIFFSRILDVSLGTLRIVFISRGYRNSAAIFGFFEVTIWILAAGQVIKNINTPGIDPCLCQRVRCRQLYWHLHRIKTQTGKRYSADHYQRRRFRHD